MKLVNPVRIRWQMNREPEWMLADWRHLRKLQLGAANCRRSDFPTVLNYFLFSYGWYTYGVTRHNVISCYGWSCYFHQKISLVCFVVFNLGYVWTLNTWNKIFKHVYCAKIWNWNFYLYCNIKYQTNTEMVTDLKRKETTEVMNFHKVLY